MVLRSLDWDGVAVGLLAVGIYVNTLGHGFVYDDNPAILTNPDVQASSQLTDVFHNDFWGTPLSSSNSHGSYRPLCTLSFRLNHWLSGFHPFGYHLANILLHGLATVLVLKVGRALLLGRTSTVAAALFAVHPVHVEAVAGLAGRADVLSSVFYLISFICYLNHVKVRDSVLFTRLPFAKNCFTTSRTTLKKFPPVRRTGESIVMFEKDSVSAKHTFKTTFFPNGESIYFSFFLVFSVCAMLSKEPGITVIPLAVCYDIILHLRSKKLLKQNNGVASSACASLLYFSMILLCRLYVMGMHTPTFSRADNPTAKESSIIVRTLTFFYLPVFNFLLLVCPARLSFDWSMDAIPRITSPFDFRVTLTALFYFVFYCTIKIFVSSFRVKCSRGGFRPKSCKVCHQGSEEYHLSTCKILNNNNLPLSCHCKYPTIRPLPKGSTVTMCLAFMVLPFLPATNIFFYVGFVVAERVLYLPSVGFCMLVAVGARVLWHHSRSLTLCGCLLLLVVMSARTLQRNRDWADEESLYRSAIHINPSKAYGNLGSVLSTAGRLDEAEATLRLALHHRPNMADAHYNLGNLLSRQDRLKEALVCYQLAIQYRPSLAVAHLNLGRVMETLERWTEAEAVYHKCGQLDVTGLKDPRSHEEARSLCLHRLSRLCQERRCQVDVAFSKVQLPSESSTFTKSPIASSRSPKHSIAEKENRRQTLYTKHTAFNKTKPSESEELFLRALRKSPNDPAAYLNYGQLLVQSGRVVEAAAVYLKAAQLAPRQHALVTSAAVALRHAGRLTEAEALYKQARDLRPADATSHSNLGAIYHLQGKYKQAASSYKEALRLAPGDHVTVTNFHKLRNLLASNKR